LIGRKGPRDGQIIGDKVLHFSDHEAVAAASQRGCMSATPLWTIAEAAGVGRIGRFPEHADRLRDPGQRLVKPGCLFVALSGTPSGGFISSFCQRRDGWEFADKAEASGGWR